MSADHNYDQNTIMTFLLHNAVLKYMFQSQLLVISQLFWEL